MVIIHEPMSTGTHILLNPSVRSPSSPQQRLTKPFFCDPISTEDRWSVQHGTSVPHHSFVLGTAPLANEPKLVNSENTVSMYKNLYQEQVEKIQSLEKELEVLRGEKKDLQATLEKLNDLLQQKEHRAVVHPFHKFRTALDDYSDIAETRTEIVESDDEDEDLEEPYVIETVPDNYLPPRKRRRGSKSVEHFYGEDYSSEDNSERRKKPNKVKAVKRVVSRHSSLMASSDDEAINNTSEPMPELPENTGVLDLSRIVTWHNELFALSKAFPYKHRLQVMTKRYEAEKQKPAYILLEADDLRLLKKHYENVGQKSRQVALYTKDFMQYFVENEDYVAGH